MSNAGSGGGAGRMVAVVIVIVLGGGCAGAQAGPGATSTATTSTGATSAERGRARGLFPVLLTARAAWSGEVRAAKLRVWADEGYRAKNPRWQEELDDDVAYANRVLIPMVGVGLAAEYRAWEHRGQAGELAAELVALARTDPGDDAVWVVGVLAGAGESTNAEQLGAAELGHVVVRGSAPGEQREALERAFPDASPEERSDALSARRRHQLTVVLLHQLAHSLGAQHEGDADAIMSDHWSPAVTAAISEDNRRRMLREVDERLATGRQVREAERLLARGDAAGALVALAPVLRLYPARVKPRVLRCRAELAQGHPQDAATVAACDAAAATGIDAALAVATARRGAGDLTGAMPPDPLPRSAKAPLTAPRVGKRSASRTSSRSWSVSGRSALRVPSGRR